MPFRHGRVADDGGQHLGRNPEYARTIVDAGNTLLALLNDILDLSKVEAGGMKLVDGTIDPKGILEQVGGSFAHDARQGTDSHGGWQGPVDRQYQAMRSASGRSFQTSSAMRSSSPTEAPSTSAAANAPFAGGGVPGLRFEVRDSGIGIARNHQAKLFEPFSQIDVSGHTPLWRHRPGACRSCAVSPS